jgi:hypothetical protein
MPEIEDKIKYYKDIIKESDKIIVEAKEMMQQSLIEFVDTIKQAKASGISDADIRTQITGQSHFDF